MIPTISTTSFTTDHNQTKLHSPTLSQHRPTRSSPPIRITGKAYKYPLIPTTSSQCHPQQKPHTHIKTQTTTMKTTYLTAFLSTFLLVSAKHRCNQYTYKNEASDGSPKTSDCKTLADNISGSGDWTSSGASQRELAKNGGCAFGTEEADGEGSALYYVGNEDIIDVINEMIKQFDPEGNGKLGGSGEFHCDVPAAKGGKAAKIKWGIY